MLWNLVSHCGFRVFFPSSLHFFIFSCLIISETGPFPVQPFFSSKGGSHTSFWSAVKWTGRDDEAAGPDISFWHFSKSNSRKAWWFWCLFFPGLSKRHAIVPAGFLSCKAVGHLKPVVRMPKTLRDSMNVDQESKDKSFLGKGGGTIIQSYLFHLYYN